MPHAPIAHKATSATPFGLSRMRPYPPAALVPASEIVLDPQNQTGVWLDQTGHPLHTLDAKHKRSETNKETKTKTSMDGNKDEGSDQLGDTD